MKIVGIIGNPIKHSLSPIMHNAAFAAKKMPYLYMPFELQTEELVSFLSIKNLKQKNIVGLNVTIPHKEAVIPFMHTLSPTAKAIGAVNTIVVKGSKLHGHNTDAAGYMMSLKKEAGFNVKGKNVVVVGAGGSARAVIYGVLSGKCASLCIVNRTLEKAQQLAKEFGQLFPKVSIEAYGLNLIPNPVFKNCDLLINTTSMGLNGTPMTVLPLELLKKKALVSDIVYTPLITPLLSAARRLKLKAHPGWGMLLYQGVLAFTLWTNKQPPVSPMKQHLQATLF
ncbi:shikimate dehydrogenase [bacterium]|nr:shikimate dehydrogenase [bacterium]